MAIISSGAKRRVAYIAEVTPGTTPATPAFTVLPVTGGNLSASKTTGLIKPVYSDRFHRDAPQSGQGAGGSYDFALAYGQFEDIFLSAMFSSGWSTDVAKDGSTRNFMTFEETEQVASSTFNYHRFLMGIVDSLSLDITSGKEITGNFSVWAQKASTPATSIIASATYNAPTANPVMSAGVSPASLSLAGLTTPLVRSLKLNLKNNIRSRMVIDSLYSAEPGEGLMEITGSAEIYVDSAAAMTAILAHTGSVACAVTLGNATNKHYTINLPNIQLGDGRRSISGPDSDGMITMPFTALYSSGSGAQMVLTRAVA